MHMIVFALFPPQYYEVISLFTRRAGKCRQKSDIYPQSMQKSLFGQKIPYRERHTVKSLLHPLQHEFHRQVKDVKFTLT